MLRSEKLYKLRGRDTYVRCLCHFQCYLPRATVAGTTLQPAAVKRAAGTARHREQWEAAQNSSEEVWQNYEKQTTQATQQLFKSGHVAQQVLPTESCYLSDIAKQTRADPTVATSEENWL